MAGAIPASIPAPLPMETEFISSNEKAVLFKNFAVGQPALRPEHDRFIEKILVPHYINQIEALKFADKIATLHPVGKASATGAKDRNLTLSIGRAGSIGASVKKHFDAQKSRGQFAKNMEIVIDARGEGDTDERQILGPMLHQIPVKKLEENSNAFRSVLMSLQMRHIVNEDDEKIFCRQLFDVKLTVTKVPANLLEQKIDEIDKKLPADLKMLMNQFFDGIKSGIKDVFKDILTAAEFSAPELFILFKGVDFIIPSEVTLVFEFKDSRGRTARYRFTGNANKIDLNAIEVFCEILSIIKWLTKLPEGLQELENELEKAKKKLNLTHEQIDKLKDGIEKLKKLAGNAKKVFDAVTAKDSLFRRLFGDGVMDNIVNAVNSGSNTVFGASQTATDFALVNFETQGVFDIFTFAGVARTLTQEVIGSATTVALDFSPPHDISLLGFRGHVLLARRWSLGLTLVSFETTNGRLFKI